MLRNKYHLGNGTINRDASRLRVVLSSASEQPVEVTDHGELAGLLDDDHSQYVHISADRTITAQHSISPINNQAPFLLGIHAQNQTVVGLKADYLNRSVIAGNGLTGGGALTSDVTLSAKADDGIDVGVSGISVDCTDLLGDGITEDAYNNFMVDCTDLLGDGITEDASNNFMVDTAFDFDWTGAHTFNSAVNLFGQTTAQHILPRYTDTYDLGSSTMLWRKGWLSELDTILFAQNAVTLLGGWLLISKDEGALVTDVTAADTQIDFGKAMTPNDFVLFRTALKVEYMQVGALVSGTTYNVTRDLDGSGANDWAGGTPFCVLGASGNGRIELNAYNTPRIQMLIQGATYNAQTELIRLGDLNGNWGYSAATYGLAIGEYASGKVNMTLDPTNSLQVRTYATTQFSVTPNLLKFGSNVSAAATTGISIFGADQTYNGEIMGNGDLLIGDNSASKANILWDKSTGKLLFRGGTTTQSYIDADGTFVAGPVKINSNGIRMPYSAVDPPGDYCYGIWSGSTPYLRIYSYGATPYINSYTSVAYIQAIDTIDAGSSLFLIAKDINTNVKLSIIISTLGDRYIQSNAKFLINDNSTTALLVEQDGVKDNVLVVDTTNGRVGVNKQPTTALDVSGGVIVEKGIAIGSGNGVSSTHLGYNSLQILTDTSYGGTYDAHSGFLIFSTLPGVWGNATLNFSVSTNWGTYDTSYPTMTLASHSVFIGDDSNANMTIGLTINQGANDNEILALKSSDVAHGVTSITETDTFALFQKYGANDGGIILRGLSETTVGVCLVGYAPTAETTKSTSVGAKVLINGYQTSETGTTNATANMNVFAIRTYKNSGTKTIFIVDEDGDIAVDGSSSIATYDEYDDVKLLTGLRASLMPEKAKLREQFSEWMEYAREPLSEAGVVTYNDDGHHFISLKGLHMLEIDAIRQLSEQFNRLALEYAALEERLEQVDARLALLADD